MSNRDGQGQRERSNAEDKDRSQALVEIVGGKRDRKFRRFRDLRRMMRTRESHGIVHSGYRTKDLSWSVPDKIIRSLTARSEDNERNERLG